MSKRAAKFNWVLEPSKFLSKEEANKLSEAAKNWAEAATAKGQKTPVRDYLITDIALSTGLRVMEIAQLDCGDIFVRDGIYSLLVRNGKCGKRRLVRFGESLKEHLNRYIAWKHEVGERTGPSDPLVISDNHSYCSTTNRITSSI